MVAIWRSTKRSERDGGFTLIELMVVVLIIAILLAIAIPTFLGARERANNRAVQSNLRNAHTNELVYYTDHQLFTDDLDVLKDMDPSLGWTDTDTDMALSPRNVYVVIPSLPARNIVIVGGKSKSGDCFWIRAVGDQDMPRFAVNDCAAVPTVFTPSWN